MSDNEQTCVWDGFSYIRQSNNEDDLRYNDLYEPWQNIILSVKTAMANISKIQRMFKTRT